MEIHTEMVNVFVSGLVCLFKSSRTILEDDPREGRPKTESTPEIVAKIQDMVLEDHRLTERYLVKL